MFTPPVRLAMFLVLILLAASSLSSGFPGWPLPLIAAALLAWGYVRNGTVWLAFRAERRGDHGRARRLLETIRRPDLLAPRNRAYYHLLLGGRDLEEGRAAPALEHLRSIPGRDLRSDHDRCLALLLTAGALAATGDPGEARRTLAEARALPHRATLDEGLEDLGRSLAPAET